MMANQGQLTMRYSAAFMRKLFVHVHLLPTEKVTDQPSYPLSPTVPAGNCLDSFHISIGSARVRDHNDGEAMITLYYQENTKSVHLEDERVNGMEVSGFGKADTGKDQIKSVPIRSVASPENSRKKRIRFSDEWEF